MGNQINRFIRIVTDFDGADIKVRAALSYENFDEIEMMAELEHIAWMNERIFRGWVPGERDAGAKTTPYLVPYADLPEDAKELDRDAIRSIPILAERTGLAVYPIR